MKKEQLNDVAAKAFAISTIKEQLFQLVRSAHPTAVDQQVIIAINNLPLSRFEKILSELKSQEKVDKKIRGLVKEVLSSLPCPYNF